MAPDLLLAKPYFLFIHGGLDCPNSRETEIGKNWDWNASPEKGPDIDPGEHPHPGYAGGTQENRGQWFELDCMAPTGL